VSDTLRRAVTSYYEGRLREHGTTAQGVDWNSGASQVLRFERLLTLVAGQRDFSLLDWGCGYGALLDHLRERELACRYTGFDLSHEMVARARERHAAAGAFTTDELALAPHDYVVASGIFNVKLEAPEAEWMEYVAGVMDEMHSRARRGFAFNMLTAYSDPEKRKAALYYADPRAVFDYCHRRFSPRVALLHDYPLFEFTVLVRKQEGLA
jgi:SAM-dependent methyltransferase